MIRKISLILLVTSLFLIACSQNTQVYSQIVEIEKIGNISLNFDIKDVAYETSSKMLYVAEDYKDFVWIYHNFDFQNKIGGKGNNTRSFQLLTDIEVSENGNLLALDNLQKRIAIFDKDGIYKSSLSLSQYSNPNRFTLGSDDLIYFYDRDDQEVVLLNLLTNQEFMRFGKFEITLPKAIRFMNDYLLVTTENYQTDIYSSLGSFVDNYQHLALKDKYQNTISLHNNFIFVNGQALTALIMQSSPQGIFLKGKTLIVYSQNEISLFNLKYKTLN